MQVKLMYLRSSKSESDGSKARPTNGTLTLSFTTTEQKKLILNYKALLTLNFK